MITTIEKAHQETLDAQKGFLTRMIITNPKGGILPSEDLTLLAQSYQWPQIEVQVVEYAIAGYQRRDAGLQNRSGSMQVTILEVVDGLVWEEMDRWSKKMHNPFSGQTGRSSDYKTSITLEMLKYDPNTIDPDADTLKDAKVSRKVVLQGAFPSQVGQLEINANESEAMQFQVDFTYNYWK